MQINEALLTLAIAAVPAALSALVSYALGRRKARAETANLIAQAYERLTDDLRKQVVDRDAVIGQLRKRIEKMQERFDVISANMRGQAEENAHLRERLAQADERIAALEAEVKRLRNENRRLGDAGEQMRRQLMGR